MRGFQKCVKIRCDSLECARQRSRITPAVAGAIVPARANKLRGLRLYSNPAQAGLV